MEDVLGAVLSNDVDIEKERKATEIMESVIRSLKLRFDALIMPLNAFKLKAVAIEGLTVCTDGVNLFFDTDYVIDRYKDRKMLALQKEVAHIVFHGLLGHFEIWDEYEHKNLLSLIMDIQAERLIRFSGVGKRLNDTYECFRDETEDENDDALDGYDFGSYYLATKDKGFFEEIKRLKPVVTSDDHRTWMIKIEKVRYGEGAGNGGEGEDEGDGGKGKDGEGKEGEGKDGKRGDKGGGRDSKEGKERRKNVRKRRDNDEVKKMWKEIRESVLGDTCANIDRGLEKRLRDTINNNYGSEAGEEVKCFKRDADEEPNEYKELLYKIANVNEYQAERDNIDYAIYQYGLSLYGNVPLIEPLECTEEKKLDTLVIAIDTSGSCDGDIMKKFIGSTVDILSEIESSIGFEGIYLLQCDTKIQKEEHYEGVYELRAAIEDEYKVYGFGGTDFRPVFERVEQLEKEGKKINALLYLSDGCGDFPDRRPDYPVYYIIPVYDNDIDYNYCTVGVNEDDLDADEAFDFLPDWVNKVELKMEYDER